LPDEMLVEIAAKRELDMSDEVDGVSVIKPIDMALIKLLINV
jgi:hypothetical protein